MEIKSLVLGLFFTLGIFAVKNGAGIAYLLKCHRSLRSRLIVCCCYAAGYSLLLAIIWLIVMRMNFIAHLNTIMHLLEGGMVVHCIFALLLFCWGILLLSQTDSRTSHGWLLLVIPCPVCFTVFIVSVSLLESLLPGSNWTPILLIISYLGLSGLAAACFSFLNIPNSERFLGAIMSIAALYFLLTILIVPHFPEIERIYRLSMGRTSTWPQQTTTPLLLIIFSFTIGIIRSLWRPLWK